ncbi:MAG TPA: GspMb/PilO family protein [Pyrinomonadaceae bacterium]
MRREEHTTDASVARVGAGGKAPAAVGRAGQVAERLARFRGSRRTSFLGVPEVVALAVAAALLAVAFAAYFLMLVPERSRLAASERERQQLQAQIRSAGESREHERSTGDAVSRILQSLTRFESEALDARGAGDKQLYEELNQKVARNGLARAQFTFVYQDDAQAGANQSSQQRAAGNLAGSARRRQNVFPSTDISLSIEGNYASLRRFIRDVESSRRFVVINGVQLEGVNDTGADAAKRGALVSLRLDMSAYFRPAGATFATTDAGGATAARQATSQ